MARSTAMHPTLSFQVFEVFMSVSVLLSEGAGRAPRRSLLLAARVWAVADALGHVIEGGVRFAVGALHLADEFRIALRFGARFRLHFLDRRRRGLRELVGQDHAREESRAERRDRQQFQFLEHLDLPFGWLRVSHGVDRERTLRPAPPGRT